MQWQRLYRESPTFNRDIEFIKCFCEDGYDYSITATRWTEEKDKAFSDDDERFRFLWRYLEIVDEAYLEDIDVQS